MHKVLIISYFHPPCNLTAANRVASWVKYLPDYGIESTVITRSWQHEVKSEKDIALASGLKEQHLKGEGFEVYEMPYKPNLRDRLLSSGKLKNLRRFLSLLEIVLQNITIKIIPFRNLYHKADELMKCGKYDALIISGNPFVQFYFGYKLWKKHKVPWIADYRDDWTTTELTTANGLLSKLIFRLERRSEKKWIGTASKICSVSPYYVKKISRLTKVSGICLYNGFEEGLVKEIPPLSVDNVFIMTFNGTLYPSQNIELFYEGFVLAQDQLQTEGVVLKLNFPGLKFKPEQAHRVEQLFQLYSNQILITDRIPRASVIEIQSNSHALLMFSHNNIKGIPSSKLYEYLGLKKPIIACPSDGDIIDEIVLTTKSGEVCNSALEICNAIVKIYKAYKTNTLYEAYAFDNKAFTREKQVSKLVDTLKKIDYETI